MDLHLDGRTAVVVGAGQTPGDTIGNGTATAVTFARAGARVVLVDRDAGQLEVVRQLLVDDGHPAAAHIVADVSHEGDCRRLIDESLAAVGSIDVLQYNVGIGSGDASVTRLEPDAWDRIMNVNVRGFYLTAKHALPHLRAQGSGVITAISSLAAIASGAGGGTAYKASKAAMNALVQQLATGNARFGIRVNAILPGLMDTPMAIGGQSRALGIDPDELRSKRDARVPLGRRQGTGWDTAYAALYLVSDEAKFVTGVVLPVDGGQSARIG